MTCMQNLLGYCHGNYADGWGAARSILWVQSFGVSDENAHVKDDWRYQGGTWLTLVYLENGHYNYVCACIYNDCK